MIGIRQEVTSITAIVSIFPSKQYTRKITEEKWYKLFSLVFSLISASCHQDHMPHRKRTYRFSQYVLFLHHLRKSRFKIPFIPSSPSGVSHTLSKGTRSGRSWNENHLPPTARSHHTASVTGARGPVFWLLIFPPLYPLFPKARPLSVQFSGSRSGVSYICRHYLSQAFVNTVFRCLQ